MGTFQQEDIIGWQFDDGRICCKHCMDVIPDTGIPLTEDDVENYDVIICDEPNCPDRRIK